MEGEVRRVGLGVGFGVGVGAECGVHTTSRETFAFAVDKAAAAAFPERAALEANVRHVMRNIAAYVLKIVVRNGRQMCADAQNVLLLFMRCMFLFYQ